LVYYPARLDGETRFAPSEHGRGTKKSQRYNYQIGGRNRYGCN
jgi:hypothetical protein